MIDAGPVIALFDRDDQHHSRVLEFMRDFRGRLISTWPVLTEVSYMLDFNKETQLNFLDWVAEGGIEVVNLEQWQLIKVREVMERYADLQADFADASLIVTAEARDLESIITLDSDFEVYKLSNGQYLSNLLDQ
ncbi:MULTISPECIES: type II toxin-antitoxin system VapC family toxin [Gracilimonas]|uniref:PIN domain-containing protein n=1 Tax=Gracilimonas sediminicola TaxID=2952158 RepID=A0A9X2RHC5_9BACT|nr:PIN domain-containing protein [Gracilimonas sediminicola]MCP9292168.1 PIN domain-containing protein [Gracilimonas sediminicola]